MFYLSNEVYFILNLKQHESIITLHKYFCFILINENLKKKNKNTICYVAAFLKWPLTRTDKKKKSVESLKESSKKFQSLSVVDHVAYGPIPVFFPCGIVPLVGEFATFLARFSCLAHKTVGCIPPR